MVEVKEGDVVMRRVGQWAGGKPLTFLVERALPEKVVLRAQFEGRRVGVAVTVKRANIGVGAASGKLYYVEDATVG